MSRTKSPAPRPSQSPGEPPWLWLGVAGAGLFTLFFFIGLYGLPGRSAPETVESPPAEVEPEMEPRIPKKAALPRVRVRELTNPGSDARKESPTEEPARETSERRNSRPAVPETTPPADEPNKPAETEASSPEPRERPRPESEPAKTQPVETPTPPRERPDPPTDRSHFQIQAGAFEVEENAQRMADLLAGAGYSSTITTQKSADGTLYRVRVGPFNDRSAAEKAVRDLGNQGIPTRMIED